jgi:hypothetical protein
MKSHEYRVTLHQQTPSQHILPDKNLMPKKPPRPVASPLLQIIHAFPNIIEILPLHPGNDMVCSH